MYQYIECYAVLKGFKLFNWFKKDKDSKDKASNKENNASPEQRKKDSDSSKEALVDNETSLNIDNESAVEEVKNASLELENTQGRDVNADEMTLKTQQLSDEEESKKTIHGQSTTPEIQDEQNQQDKETLKPFEQTQDTAIVDKQDSLETDISTQEDPGKAAEKQGFFARLKASLSKTKANIGSGFSGLLLGKSIDDDLYEDLETQLLIADVGMKTTNKIIDELTTNAKRSQLKDGDALSKMLQQQMQTILSDVNKPLDFSLANKDDEKTPFVILMVGVNGVGKTTTIGKLAKQFQAQGKSVMLAAGDTFRAAAVEQLQVWGERNNIPVIAQHTGADSASVIFDAIQSAKSKRADVLIADTAGRLQNKDHLIEELKKVVRVMKKIDPQAPHEIMLTLDASTGQNAVSQTKIFNDAVGITGINLTKLDGSAKGGVIFALADEFKIPVRYIGIGEGIDDLKEFDAKTFVEALFADE